MSDRLRLRLRRHSFESLTLGAQVISRGYVMNSGLSVKAMGRVGRPFQGRRREEARRQARHDRARAGKKEQMRVTISVEKYSPEWSVIEPQKNRSQFIRDCVRKYPTLVQSNYKLQQELAQCRALVKMHREQSLELQLLRDTLVRILEEHSIDWEDVIV